MIPQAFLSVTRGIRCSTSIFNGNNGNQKLEKRIIMHYLINLIIKNMIVCAGNLAITIFCVESKYTCE